MKSPVALLLACALAIAGAWSCREEKRPGTVTITFWHSFVANTIPALDALTRKFEQDHPTIHIKSQYIPTGDALIQKLVAAVQSSTAPDVAWIHSDFLEKLVQGNAIYRMDEFIHGPDSLSADDLADIFPPLLQSAKWRDTLYALPMEATSLALIYNKSLFTSAGLNPDHPPADWNELREYTRKLTIDEDGDGRFEQYGFYVPVFPASGELNIWMILQWTPFLWQAGGREINDQQTRVLFNSAAGIQALALWKEMYDVMNFRTFGIAHDVAFASQKLAMVLDGPWNLPRYRTIKNFTWGVAPLPRGPVRRATYIAGEHLAIFRQSKHAGEAWTFIKWILRPEVQAFFSQRSGYLPVRQSTLRLPEYMAYMARDPQLSTFIDQMRYAESRHPIDRHRVEINHFLAEAIERCTLGGWDPRSALDEAAKKSDELLAASPR